VADPSAKFLYVTDYSADAIDTFSINASTGALASANAPVPIGSGGNAGGGAVAMDPKGKFLFATAAVAFKVASFAVNSSTGALTPVPGSSVATGASPFNGVVDPTGKFLYVGNLDDLDGGISAYTISSTGALTPIPGSPFASLPGTNPGPEGLAVSPDGRFLYVALDGPPQGWYNFVAGFTIDAITGALGLMQNSPFFSGTGPSNVVVDPTGKFLYTTDLGDGTISAFSIDPTSGELNALSGYPLQVGVFMFGIGIDQSGKFLYASDLFTNYIYGFTITATGALTPVGQPIGAGHSPSFLTIAKIP